ncbi:Hypothetical predicted protein [Xyrichtys novacula]|uniref:Uncharacterized protein n=1 Tax=Xyrichtys novacula TaxID=13765 RepID=A0AAV1EXY6_XYRNO|nr:Hypothetical predicted protein [Xyrichtys novacula]
MGAGFLLEVSGSGCERVWTTANIYLPTDPDVHACSAVLVWTSWSELAPQEMVPQAKPASLLPPCPSASMPASLPGAEQDSGGCSLQTGHGSSCSEQSTTSCPTPGFLLSAASVMQYGTDVGLRVAAAVRLSVELSVNPSLECDDYDSDVAVAGVVLPAVQHTSSPTTNHHPPPITTYHHKLCDSALLLFLGLSLLGTKAILCLCLCLRRGL